jgi:hypothetical protein
MIKKIIALLLAFVATACSSGNTPTAPLTGIPIEAQTSIGGSIISCGGPPTHGSPPTLYACDDSYSMKRGETLLVPAPGLLANDAAPAGSDIVFGLPLPPGTLMNTGGGGFSYSPDVGQAVKTVVFSYSIILDGTPITMATMTYARITVTIQ